ncbi:MAG: hypothetical protein DWI11_07360 [Planctomycetota bacterium]|nr:MAG: hypothetical protein DWI11_07360 [Planctomycetota bacterium]
MQKINKLALASAAGLAALIAASAQAQVAGDECTNALTAVVGVNTSSTVTMTPSANAPVDGPCNFLDWGASKDVFFVFNAANPGLLDLDFCASGYDTSVVVYTGSCAALTRISCDDDSCPTGTLYQSFKLGIPVASAGPVYIRVGGYLAASGAVNFTLGFTESTANCASTLSCGTVHAEPGCADQLCCGQVCAINPLCCDLGWDAQCVQAAVDTCGYFVYTCVAGGPANNCATNAQVVSSSSVVAFNSSAATIDGPKQACPGTAIDIFADVWFKIASPANGVLSANTCNQVAFDSKIAIYDMGTSPSTFDYNTLNTAMVACNDDGSSTCYMTGGTTAYASDLSITAAVGHTYLVRVGGFAAADAGAGTVTFSVPVPCVLPSATGSETEACGTDSNGGCDAAGTTASAQAITLGSSIGGTFWADAGVRDVDWYTVTVAADTTATLNLYSASNAIAFIFPGDPCSPLGAIASGSGSCPSVATGCLSPGIYSIAVATANFTDNPCGNGVFNNYVLATSGAPAVCPIVSEVCTNPVDNVVSQNNGTVITNYGFNCLLFCGTNASTFTVAAQFARSFPGLNAGALGCVSFGYANMNVMEDGVYENGTPTVATIGVYRDINGGAPTTVGGDLVLIQSVEVLLLGGVQTVTWNIDAPIDLTGNADPIVIVFDVPEAGGCDVATNGLLGGVGNNGGATAPYYERSLSTYAGLCEEPAFIANADPTSQWICTIGVGSATTPCPADFNGSGTVDAADLATLLNGWGASGATDLDGNGITDAADLASVLNAWGGCP